MRIAIAVAVALAGAVVTAGAAIASDHQPDSRYNETNDISNLWVETTACPGFSTTSPLLFAGTIHAKYDSWLVDPFPPPTEEGWAQIRVSATDGVHSYRIHQRYDHPREFREFIYGYATTVVLRDDGATMTGSSWLGIDGNKGNGGAEGVWWLETPTCASGKSRRSP